MLAHMKTRSNKTNVDNDDHTAQAIVKAPPRKGRNRVPSSSSSTTKSAKKPKQTAKHGNHQQPPNNSHIDHDDATKAVVVKDSFTIGANANHKRVPSTKGQLHALAMSMPDPTGQRGDDDDNVDDTDLQIAEAEVAAALDDDNDDDGRFATAVATTAATTSNRSGRIITVVPQGAAVQGTGGNVSRDFEYRTLETAAKGPSKSTMPPTKSGLSLLIAAATTAHATTMTTTTMSTSTTTTTSIAKAPNHGHIAATQQPNRHQAHVSAAASLSVHPLDSVRTEAVAVKKTQVGTSTGLALAVDTVPVPGVAADATEVARIRNGSMSRAIAAVQAQKGNQTQVFASACGGGSSKAVPSHGNEKGTLAVATANTSTVATATTTMTLDHVAALPNQGTGGVVNDPHRNITESTNASDVKLLEPDNTTLALDINSVLTIPHHGQANENNTKRGSSTVLEGIGIADGTAPEPRSSLFINSNRLSETESLIASDKHNVTTQHGEPSASKETLAAVNNDTVASNKTSSMLKVTLQQPSTSDPSKSPGTTAASAPAARSLYSTTIVTESLREPTTSDIQASTDIVNMELDGRLFTVPGVNAPNLYEDSFDLWNEYLVHTSNQISGYELSEENSFEPVPFHAMARGVAVDADNYGSSDEEDPMLIDESACPRKLQAKKRFPVAPLPFGKPKRRRSDSLESSEHVPVPPVGKVMRTTEVVGPDSWQMKVVLRMIVYLEETEDCEHSHHSKEFRDVVTKCTLCHTRGVHKFAHLPGAIFEEMVDVMGGAAFLAMFRAAKSFYHPRLEALHINDFNGAHKAAATSEFVESLLQIAVGYGIQLAQAGNAVPSSDSSVNAGNEPSMQAMMEQGARVVLAMSEADRQAFLKKHIDGSSSEEAAQSQ